MMQKYAYSLCFNAMNAVISITLGYFVFKGASVWLVLPMVLIATSYVIPGKEKFTCPKCGYTATVKTFTASQACLDVEMVDKQQEDA